MENITLVVVKPPKSKLKPCELLEETKSDVAAMDALSQMEHKEHVQPKLAPNQKQGLLSNNSLCSKFLSAGAAACFADAATFPLDTAKVRLQVQKILVNVKTMPSYNGILLLYYLRNPRFRMSE